MRVQYTKVVCLGALGVVKPDQSWYVVLTHLAVTHYWFPRARFLFTEKCILKVYYYY